MADGLSDSERAWMLAHADETLVPNIIACIAISGAASILFLGLRVWSRQITYGYVRLELSDWFLLVAWIFYAAQAVFLGIATEYGTGHHIIVVTNFRMFHIVGLLSEVVYFNVLAFLKLSILSFYGHIFPQRLFHYWLWAVSVLVASWDISFTFVTIFQCNPVSYAWDTNQPGHCINYGTSQLASGVINIITDILILVMPIPLIWKLNITKQKKRQVTLTFAIGCTACLVSVVRLAWAQTLDGSDGSWAGVSITYISIIETTVGILAVSIPTYKPLYKRLVDSSNYYFRRGYMENSSNKDKQRGELPQKSMIPSAPRESHVAPHINVTHQIELVRHTKMGGSWVRVSEDDERQLYDPGQNSSRDSSRGV
ncbi:hypothetical protein HD806DRAFT_477917 [Xylariaceae sp. AK1471]|nr:hypothetical protein HD806DRAFT_477917 [Xylariaceae sp. AK1471]